MLSVKCWMLSETETTRALKGRTKTKSPAMTKALSKLCFCHCRASKIINPLIDGGVKLRTDYSVRST